MRKKRQRDPEEAVIEEKPETPVTNVDDFIKLFGFDAGINEGTLEDMACPHCGSRGNFGIDVSCVAIYSDEGCEDTGDMEWGNHSFISCRACDTDGDVHEFMFEGLDKKLEELKENN